MGDEYLNLVLEKNEYITWDAILILLGSESVFKRWFKTKSTQLIQSLGKPCESQDTYFDEKLFRVVSKIEDYKGDWSCDEEAMLKLRGTFLSQWNVFCSLQQELRKQ